MSRSYRTTTARIDSSALARLMEIACQTDIYNNRREARQDNYEAVVMRLCDEFEEDD